jgi:uncharacterized protein YjdB
MHVLYQAHVQDLGWLREVTDAQVAGTPEGNKRIEAVRIQLTGP